MATRPFNAAPAVAINLVADLGLVRERDYLIQNIDPQSTLKVFEGGATAPAVDTRAHEVRPGETWYIRPAPGAPIWVWSAPGTCFCVISEAL